MIASLQAGAFVAIPLLAGFMGQLAAFGHRKDRENRKSR